MLTPRNFITTTGVIAIVSILSVCWSMLQDPDGGGLRSDSYGVYATGHRALFDTLAELDVPVHRSVMPPDTRNLSDSVFVLWKPDPELVESEPRWLRSLGDWVRSGGELILAVDTREKVTLQNFLTWGRESTRSDADSEQSTPAGDNDHSDTDRMGNDNAIFELLGLRSISLDRVSPDDHPEPEPSGEQRDVAPRRQDYSVTATGFFADLVGQQRVIELAQDGFDVLNLGSQEISDAIFVRSSEDTELAESNDVHCIAARFPVGTGMVTVVSTPQLISNNTIASADHLVIATALLHRGDRTIVFDEFYHGATIRGNPLWLFTRRSYAIIAVSLLALAAAIIWRAAVFLGPPLADVPARRRSVAEYLDAMSALQRRSRGHEQWTLRNVRDGILWRLRRDHGLPVDQKETDPLLSAIARHDPDQAGLLEQLLKETDQYVNSDRAVSERQTGPLMKRMTACLLKTGTKRSAMKSRR